jgi:hypothetical protein
VTVLRETTSPAGRLVRLTEAYGTYAGAAPYYALCYERPVGKILRRFTPLRDRADRLFAPLSQDVTDPAALAPPPRVEREVAR